MGKWFQVRAVMPGLVSIGLILFATLPTTGRAQTSGGTVQEKLDRLQSLSGAERQRFLEEQASKEGKVVMYTGDDPNLIHPGLTLTLPPLHLLP